MYKLMIVDDEPEILKGISQYFPWEDLGFTVVCHLGNGKSAYDYICHHSVDVVLCDINMPVMNGLELAKLIHENYPDIQIVFLSGYSKFSYAKQALEYNVKSYILKSAKYNELIRVFSRIHSELDSARYGDNLPEKPEPEFSSFDDKVIDTIKKYINKHYADVTLEDLTEQVHMNPQYISKFFKKITGQNFSDYLMEVRMKKAAQLLEDIQYKTYEVSALVGYSNSVNFTRAFKRFYGMSPKEYRGRSTRTPADKEHTT